MLDTKVILIILKLIVHANTFNKERDYPLGSFREVELNVWKQSNEVSKFRLGLA